MYEIFAQLLEENEVTPYQVHKATGVAQSSLSDWKNGKSKPKYEKIRKIAEYFNVTVDYLLGNEKKSLKDDVFSSEIKSILNRLQALSPDNLAKLSELIDLYLNSQDKK